MTLVRHFDALVEVVDDGDPAFAASLVISDDTVTIHVLDITIGSWAVGDVSAVTGEDGVLIEVPGSLLHIHTDDDSLLAESLRAAGTTHAGVA